MSIRLITFDLDDTFWDVASVMHGAEAELRQWLSIHAQRLGAVPIEHFWAIRSRVIQADPSLRHRMSTLRRQILLNALLEAGYPASQAAELAEAAFQVFLAARHKVSFFAGVHATLEQLAGQYILGVITNGNADVRRLGLAEHFQFMLSAEELGVGKPDRRPFDEALKRAGVRPEQAVHIGDHPADDIAGAQGAGFHAIWYNPQGRAWEAPQPPSAQIQHLQELPTLLANWRHSGR